MLNVFRLLAVINFELSVSKEAYQNVGYIENQSTSPRLRPMQYVAALAIM